MLIGTIGGPLAATATEVAQERRITDGKAPTMDAKGSYPKLKVVTRTGKYGTHSEILDENGRLIADVFGGEPLAQLLASAPCYLAQLHILETTLNIRAVVNKLLTFNSERAFLAALAVTLGSEVTKRDMERFRHIMTGTPKAA